MVQCCDILRGVTLREEDDVHGRRHGIQPAEQQQNGGHRAPPDASGPCMAQERKRERECESMFTKDSVVCKAYRGGKNYVREN